MQSRRAHWFRENKANRYPRRIVCLDSEAYRNESEKGERHSLRLAFATFDRIDKQTREPKTSEDSAFVDSAELWDWIIGKTTQKERLVVFAHNLGYDLRLTEALTILPSQGWEVLDFSLDNYRCWIRWRRGKSSLLMVDTLSFVGKRLATFADGEHWQKPELPTDDAPFEQWLQRCRSDTYLLRSVVLRLLDFMEAEECGNFRMTGAAQASAAFRHKFLKPRALLIHEDEEALAAERRAAWTGRCEVWRHGEVKEELHEWDYSLAYARIARSAKLPTKYAGKIANPSESSFGRMRESCRLLCEVTVTTLAPIAPSENDGRILWPLGTFPTTLWDCEIDLLREHGADIRFENIWYYRTSPLLQEWGQWIIDRLEGEDAATDAVIAALLKGWSRSLIGRFGLRYAVWQQAGLTPDADFLSMPFRDLDTNQTGEYLRLGRQLLVQEEMAESPDSAPAVMAYVMAQARANLWRAIQAIPEGGLVYCDTDSLIVTATASDAVARFADTSAGWGLRLKRTYTHGQFSAPRQVSLGHERRMAGLPRKARDNGDGSYSAEVWESPQASLQRGSPNGVTIHKRIIRPQAKDHRRRHLEGGATEPFTLETA